LDGKCPYVSVRGSPGYRVKYADLQLPQRRFVLDDYK